MPRTVPYSIEKTVPLDLDANIEAHLYAAGADAENTKRGYSADWRHFSAWAKKRNAPELPAKPDDIALYLRHCVETLNLKTSTVQRRIAAISWAHRSNGLKTPTTEWVIKNTLRRLVREHGKPVSKKKPLLFEDLKTLLDHIPPTLTGFRDKAILLLGFAGAFRRSDLAGLDYEDIAVAKEGLVVTIRRGKTDQGRKGRRIGIPFGTTPETCVAKALDTWLTAAKITSGAIFRKVDKHGHVQKEPLSPSIVGLIVKQYAKCIGKRPSTMGAHSLRSGFITSAALAGAPEWSIQEQSGHRSLKVLREYIQVASLFKENAVSKIGL